LLHIYKQITVFCIAFEINLQTIKTKNI